MYRTGAHTVQPFAPPYGANDQTDEPTDRRSILDRTAKFIRRTAASAEDEATTRRRAALSGEIPTHDPACRREAPQCYASLHDTAYDPLRAFPGIPYAGDGRRLAGGGPDAFTDAQGDALPFKAVIRGTPPMPGQGAEMHAGDRLWVLPTRHTGCDATSSALSRGA